MASHEKLVEDASRAIQQVFGDDSVSKSQTVESLESLKEEIEDMISTIDVDDEG